MGCVSFSLTSTRQRHLLPVLLNLFLAWGIAATGTPGRASPSCVTPGPGRTQPDDCSVSSLLQRDTAAASIAHDPTNPNCLGNFTNWGPCSDTCRQERTYVIQKPTGEGGQPCEHAHKWIDVRPCVGGSCAHQELAPAGELPGDDKPEAHIHFMAMGLQLPIVGAVIGSIIVGEILHHTPYLSAVPHSLVVVLVSGLVGVIVRVCFGSERWQTENFSPVSSSLMSLVLLPIIIFQSGWALSLKPFWKNFGYILIFALMGTAVSTFVIASMIHAFGSRGYHVVSGYREALAISALISATDPVATLASFAVKQVEPTLNALVFGEATINDAIAIVFFKLINIDQPTSTFTWRTASLQALWMLFGSIALGLFSGCKLTSILRLLRSFCQPQAFSEVLYIFSSAYLTNGLAESLHLSGIIACLFSGMIMGIYSRPHLSQQGEKAADTYLDVSAKVADQAVFVMVGITTALLNSSRGMRFGMYLFAFCLLGRLVSVLTCTLCCNSIRTCRGEPTLVTAKRSFMIWHAGLRGGIALTLVLELNDWAEHKAVLVTAVFITIFLLLLLMGSTTDLALTYLHIEKDTGGETQDYAHLNTLAIPAEGDPLGLKAVKGIHRGLHVALVGDSRVKCKRSEQTDANH